MEKYKSFLVLLYSYFFIFGCKNIFARLLSERLLFVGEEVKVLTVASRYPEKPSQAPAVAQVFTAEQIKAWGIRTLGELLSQLPGFFVNPLEGGSIPYLRGLPNGVLFLYDGVPLTSDSTKNVHPLDEELSLDHIDRVEIVRGPASVLWGPDAFAGVVNIVPKKGLKKGGFLKVSGGAPNHEVGVSFAYIPRWSKIKSYWGLTYYAKDPLKKGYNFLLGDQWWSGEVGRSEFYEGIFSLNFSFLELSGRFSTFRRSFVLQDEEKSSWPAERQTPLSFIKFSARKKKGHMALKFWGYYAYLNQKLKEISLTQEEKNHIFYGEILLTRELFSRRGLLTLGLGYRQNLVRDAAVRVRGYFPSFLAARNKQFRPLIETADFNTYLSSFFFQYRHFLRDSLEFWWGVRFDDHNQYHPGLNYHLGFRWQPTSWFYAKTIWGTSYRTPYSSQFLDHVLKNPEEIRTLTGELCFRIGSSLNFKVSPFYSRVAYYVDEDPYGGYSFPFKEYFLGSELAAKWVKGPLHLWANLSWVNHWGEKERYQVLDYIIFVPGSPPEIHYSFYEKPFHNSPHVMANLGILFRTSQGFDIFLRVFYHSSYRFSYLKNMKDNDFSSNILWSITLKKKNLLSGLDFTIKVENIFDEKYKLPGEYTSIEGPRFNFFLYLEKKL